MMFLDYVRIYNPHDLSVTSSSVVIEKVTNVIPFVLLLFIIDCMNKTHIKSPFIQLETIFLGI